MISARYSQIYIKMIGENIIQEQKNEKYCNNVFNNGISKFDSLSFKQPFMNWFNNIHQRKKIKQIWQEMKKNGFGHGMTIISGRSFSDHYQRWFHQQHTEGLTKDFMGVPTFVGFLL